MSKKMQQINGRVKNQAVSWSVGIKNAVKHWPRHIILKCEIAIMG